MGVETAGRSTAAKRRAAGARRKLRGEDASTAELESVVFGRPEPIEGAEEEVEKAAAAAAEEEGEAADGEKAKKKRKKAKQEKAEKDDVPTKAAAWADPDDAGLEVDLTSRNRTMKLRRTDAEKKITGDEYERRLRNQFVKLHGNMNWAAAPRKVGGADGSSDEEAEAPATSAKILAAPGKGGALRPGELNMQRLKEVAIEPGAKKGPAVIQALQFHPNSELLLTAGMDKKLRLYSVDGEENAKVASYFFKKFPIMGASFSPAGDQILMNSKCWRMWSLDVQTGTPSVIRPVTAQCHNRFFGLTVGPSPSDNPGLRSSSMYSVMGDTGSVLLCDMATKHVIRTFRMSTAGVATAFSRTRDTIFTVDEESNIYEWDVGTGRCLQRAKDPWAVKVTSLATCSAPAHSSSGPLLAVGTSSGNVDLFDVGGPRLPAKPNSSIDNLTTSITRVGFHHEGELMIAASRMKKDAMKVVHTGTSTVFQNWPTMKTPLEKVSVFDMSRQDGLLAIGNERGRVLLYQLAHYKR